MELIFNLLSQVVGSLLGLDNRRWAEGWPATGPQASFPPQITAPTTDDIPMTKGLAQGDGQVCSSVSNPKIEGWAD